MAAALSYILLCLIWGSTWLFIRIGLSEMPPFWSLALRQLIATCFLVTLSLQRGSNFRTLRKHIWLILLVGFLTHPVSYSLVYWGEQYVSSGLAAVLFSGMPFFVALFSWWMLPHERVTPLVALGLVLGFSGIAVVYWDHLNLGGPNLAIGMACIIGSGLIAAFTTVAIKKWLGGTSPVALATVTVSVGAVVMPFLALGTEQFDSIHWNITSMGTVIYLGILGSGLTFLLYYRLLSQLPALTMSLIAFITPIVALILGGLFDREVYPLRSWIGTGMVLGGVLLATLVARRASPDVRTL